MGVVLAASYEAKAHGVRTAMGHARARRLCPDAIVVPPRMSAYSEASKDVFRVFEHTAPVVEGLSIDEAFLDVRGMERSVGTPVEIAERLRREVREQVGLPVTVGVARTKFLAKVASGVAKPDGLLVVPPDGELEFLHPLPVERLWGVGAVTAGKLHRYGILRVGQVALLPEPVLVSIVGRASGRQLHALAHNRDPRARPHRQATRLDRLAASPRPRALVAGSRRRRPARARRPGHTAHANSGARRTDGRPAPAVRRLQPRNEITHAAAGDVEHRDDPVGRTHAAARALPTIEDRGLTLIGISVANLDDARCVQLALPFDGRDRDALDATVDLVRERFGSTAITRAVLLGRRDLTMPLLPD